MNSPNPEVPQLQIAWKKVQGVVMFVDLASFFPVVHKTGLDDLGTLISGFYNLCATEIRRQKGEVVSLIGDAVLAFFRPEGCSGMDPEWCATRSAFHLVKNFKKVSNELEMNVGITTGEILEGRCDIDGRVQAILLGDVVNRAAILAGGKQLKGIHASKKVLQVLGPRVSHEKLAIRFPGNTEDEIVYRLVSLVL